MFWGCTILKFYIRVIEAGIGFALVLAVVFASFRTQKPEKKRYIVFLGILTGFIGSIVSAILRSIPNYINRTNFAFWSMIPVSIFFLILIVLLLFKTKAKKSLLYENIFGTTVFLYTAATIFYYLPVIITLSTTLVNYGESAVSTLVLYRLIGYLLGIVFIILASLSIYKTLIKLSDIELNITVIASLCILGITQVVVIIQRLYSLRIIPRNDFIFWFIATVVNNGNFFIFAVIVFIMFAPILLWKKNIKITEAYNNNAELRKIKAKKRNAKRWARFSLSLLLISVFSLSFLRFYVDREVPLSPPENYTIEEGMAVISLEQLEDDKLHRYEYITEQGISMRFIAKRLF